MSKARGRPGAQPGNKNAAGPRKGYGSPKAAIKAFGPRPSGGIFGMSTTRRDYDIRVDTYLGHSANKGANGQYKLATTRSIKKAGW